MGAALWDLVGKAEMSSKAVNDLPDSAFAYIEPGGKKDADGKTTPRSKRHFPIHDAAHVRAALSRAPQSPFGDKAMPKIRSAAKKFGVEVSKEAQEPVGKAMPTGTDDGVDGMDPTVLLGQPDGEAPGDPMDPGSPAWEELDAATASKWTSILARAKAAIDLLSDREMMEAASGADPDDADSAMDLQDACCAIDYAISILAPFAISEQSEADCGADAMAALGKALGDFDPQTLDTVETLGQVRKAGRVLSASNEAAIRSAAESLQKVLASLPQAPEAPEAGAPVTKNKEETVTAPSSNTPVEPAGPAQMGTTKDDATPAANDGKSEPAPVVRASDEPVTKSAEEQIQWGLDNIRSWYGSSPALRVAVYDAARSLTGLVAPAAIVQKADADGGKTTMQAVFDEDGNLVGIVDPADITPVSGAGGKASDDDDADSDSDDSGSDDGTGDDMAAAPAAEVGTPADATTSDDDSVAKATSPLSDEAMAAIVEQVTKALAAHTQTPDAEKPDEATDVEKSDTSDTTDGTEVLKSSIPEPAAAPDDHSAALQELAKAIEELKGDVHVLKEQPVVGAVFANGAVPPRHLMRGQADGAAPVDQNRAELRKQRLYAATSTTERQRIFDEMQTDAIAELARIQQR
jgi:hypothetical protein